jgi:hypothetical protein
MARKAGRPGAGGTEPSEEFCNVAGSDGSETVLTPPSGNAQDFRENEGSATRYHAAQFKLFTLRCLDLADRVAAGRIAFLDAIDICYEAAIWAGLVDDLGDDLIQACMAAAFANAKRPP